MIRWQKLCFFFFLLLLEMNKESITDYMNLKDRKLSHKRAILSKISENYDELNGGFIYIEWQS